MTSPNRHTRRIKRRTLSPLAIIFICLLCAAVVCLSFKLSAGANATKEHKLLGIEDINTVLTPGHNNQIKNYAGFTVGFNEENHTPDWVAWELLGSETDGNVSRSNKFWTDSDLTGCPDSRDYTSSGYDRGHMSPAAEHKWSDQAMHDSFSMANICPQFPALNRGVWQTLEKLERHWAKRDSAILIVAGPIYTDNDKTTIGNSRVRVPSAFYKAFFAPYGDKPKAIAFVFPNVNVAANIKEFAMTVDQLEDITGYDFFHALPDDIENPTEAVSSFKEWTRQKSH